MTNSFFKQAIFISFLGHITLFSMFSFSFGPRIPDVNFTHVCFWGPILRNADLLNSRNMDKGYRNSRFTGKSEISVLDKINQENFLVFREYLKPQVSLVFSQEKMLFAEKITPPSFTALRKEPAIIFYPKLPYHFALYFKDRQTVHIELSFEVILQAHRSSALVKRRISSGNLEADLLSMRYISRYLFIQQRGFTPNKWQIVKIDLSTVND